MNINMPTHCYFCGTPLVLNEKHTKLYCPNDACASHIGGRIKKWTLTLGIKNFGDSTINDLTDRLCVNTVNGLNDLYNHKVYEELSEYEGWGENSANKLWEELQAHKEMTLTQFMTGLNICSIGERLWDKIISYFEFSTIEEILNVRDFTMDQIGAKRSETIVNTIKSMKKEILALEKLVTIKTAEKKETTGGKLGGKSFCFTGKSSLPRKQLWALVEQNGGIVNEGCTKDTNFLVLADINSTSGKAKAAKKNGTTLLTEEQFMEMIR